MRAASEAAGGADVAGATSCDAGIPAGGVDAVVTEFGGGYTYEDPYDL